MNFEQRANIKFCFKLGKTFTETHNLMKQVYGDNCVARASIYEWYTRFKNGREDINDDAHTGRPKSTINENSIEVFMIPRVLCTKNSFQQAKQLMLYSM
ncbi:FLJ37770-like protein [Acromyrmex echinatior]|uniref:FLJ37770-like protein n=1 Tax=Acromyrmex echinatior TaxID=103372 RepID=F4W6E9_ACREC|nr:FLJ37770-like protein [Acromyrmex echinatior]